MFPLLCCCWRALGRAGWRTSALRQQLAHTVSFDIPASPTHYWPDILCRILSCCSYVQYLSTLSNRLRYSQDSLSVPHKTIDPVFIGDSYDYNKSTVRQAHYKWPDFLPISTTTSFLRSCVSPQNSVYKASYLMCRNLTTPAIRMIRHFISSLQDADRTTMRKWMHASFMRTNLTQFQFTHLFWTPVYLLLLSTYIVPLFMFSSPCLATSWQIQVVVAQLSCLHPLPKLHNYVHHPKWVYYALYS